jgi:2-keto-4-pentenoate hydratase/2-oxohepta-3-ene-1,7-dioic acid hydratase in catechol pathway
MRVVWIVVAVVLVLFGLLAFQLFRPLGERPVPAGFHCYELEQGAYVPLGVPPHAFGIGLSYAGHIEETASDFDPDASPPVFVKRSSATARDGAPAHLPTSDELIQIADAFEPGLGERLRADYPAIPALLDYEVEMGVVLLEYIDPSRLEDPGFAPRLGFFIANDLSARSIAILGEGRANRYEYWGVSKSFPGFMPIADRAWVPAEAKPNGIPCVEIETLVNGQVRQRQSTANLIYTPRQMIGFVHVAFPEVPLTAGTIVLTGTPGGVAMKTPRWLVRLGNLVGLGRFEKLSAKLRADTSAFLDVGDEVMVRGGGLGEVRVTIAP